MIFQRNPPAVSMMALLALLTVHAFAVSAPAQGMLWTRQIGTPELDGAGGVAVDGLSNVYVTGFTRGNVGGPNAGSADTFLVKYDATGTLLWARQLGTSSTDLARGVAVDGAGNVYITGYTSGSLGGPSAGETDAFLAKYDASGNLLWTRQIGSSARDEAKGVAVDEVGNAYIVGMSLGNLGGPSAGHHDAFVARYDSSGNLLWVRQIGTTSRDEAKGVAVDEAGNAYIIGYTGGSLAGLNAGDYDIFLVKYHAEGVLLWKRQTGSIKGDHARAVAVDGAGNAYITGFTEGSLGGTSAGGNDAYLGKYDASGHLLWMRQAGGSRSDGGQGVAVDGVGNAYITGWSGGGLPGPTAGSNDAFLANYDRAGRLRGVRLIGRSGYDIGYGVSLDNAGNAYITGETDGGLGWPVAGLDDVFLVKYGVSCYADCEQTTGSGILDIFDFLCFQSAFITADPYACDCDTSTGNGVCDILDFICFQDAFVAGCP